MFQTTKSLVRRENVGIKSKASEIASGYKNLLKSKLGLSSQLDEALFTARREICDACEFKSALDRCLKCGCPLAAKTKSYTSECPEKHW